MVGNDGSHGNQLWKSDGTAAGTGPVTNFSYASPYDLTDVNGIVYFGEDNTGTSQPNLWRSDGTAVGTAQVSSSNSFIGPEDITNVNGTVYEVVTISQGPQIGTQRLAQGGNVIGELSDFYSQHDLRNVNGHLLFVAYSFSEGMELYYGPSPNAVWDLSPGPSDSFNENWPANDLSVVTVGGSLFFGASQGTPSTSNPLGCELWMSQGGTAYPRLVKDINPGIGSSNPYDITDVNGTAFFTADDGIHGRQLWRSNGTDAETSMVYNFGAGHTFANFTNVNGTLFFTLDGTALWKSNGTTAGTVRVAGGFSNLANFTNANGTLFFTSGNALWQSDGTPGGTVPVAGAGSYPHDLAVVNGTLVFGASDGSAQGLWRVQPPLGLSVPSSVTAGAGFSVTINAGFGYTGTVHFTSADPQATLPADYTFTGADRGIHTFTGVVLRTSSGTESVTVTDTGNGSLRATGTLNVEPAAPSRFTVTAPGSTSAGAPLAVRVMAYDPYNNLAVNYGGVVHFTSSDPQAGLPADAGLSNGVGNFTAILRTAGPQTLTATAVANSSVTGRAAVTVTPAAASWFALTAPTSVTAGTAFGVTVTAKDPYNNTAPSYAGTIRFSSSDPQAMLPANAPLSNGTGTFNVTLKTAGTQSLVVRDTANGALTGTVPISSADFMTPTAVSGPGGITAGPDGNVWFIESSANKIAKVTSAGVVTEYPVPTANSDAVEIVAGADGSLWFTEFNSNKIGKITPSGTVTEYPVLTAGSGPDGITLGPDGNVWFTEFNPSKIGRITPAGTVTEFALAAGTHPLNLAPGSDGNVWFTEYSTNKIGRITPTGSVTEFAIPSAQSSPIGIALGPDANLWFVEYSTRRLGRITPTGSVTEFPIPASTPGVPYAIAAGPDGAVWFTLQSGSGRLGRVTVAGAFTDYPPPTADGNLSFLTAGPDHNLWFSESGVNKVGRYLMGVAVVPAAPASLTVSAPATVAGGVPFAVTVAAKDAYGNTAWGYTGTVHLTSSDTQATLPGNYTFTAADAGSHTFSVTVRTLGNQSVTAADTLNGAFRSTAAFSVVQAGVVTHFRITAPTAVTAGSPFAITVTALDGANYPVTTYSGTVHFTSSDGQAVLPADAPLSGGTGTFNVTFKTAGSQSVRVADKANGTLTGTSPTIQVSSAAPSRFTLTVPAGATIGVPFTITLSVLDAYNNLVTGYGGTVHFSSSDSQAVLPGNATLTNGSGTFAVTLKTAGNQTVTATDTANSALTVSRTVPASAPPVRFLVTAPANAPAGAPFTITVTALDATDNTAIGYTGTIHFTSSDPQAVLPVNATLTNGTGTFSVTLKTAGTQSVVATDTANSNLTGSAFNLIDFGTPTASSGPLGIGPGPDGNVWFIEYRSNRVARITPAGVVTEFPVFAGTPGLSGIVAGADGNLWATEYYPNKIARITPAGVVTEFAAPTANSGPDGITLGPDGNIWFTEFLAGRIGRITPSGVVSDFGLSSSSAQPVNLAAGPDGNVWFTEAYANKIGRITPAGVVSEFAIPSAASSPIGIAAGADGALWFTEQNTRRIGRITPSGSITELVVPASIPGQPYGMAAGSDGALWFTMRSGAGRLGRVTVAGAFTDYALPSPNGDPNFIIKGPDGNIWFTEYAANRVGRFQAGVTVQPGPTASFLVRPATGTVTAGNSFNVTVTAQDAYGNPTPGYNGTIHFTSNDPQAVLPANAMLRNGSGTFSATLKTAGRETITATDVGNSALTGTGTVTVQAAAAARLALGAPTTATAGSAFSITVTAYDAYNNIATGYTGTVHFTSTDSQATLPANTPLTNGTGTFSVTLGTAGPQTVTATDTSNGSLTATSGTIQVNPGAATYFLVSPSVSSVLVGTPFSITVTAYDAYNNVATGYTGTVTFSSTDSQATLPANTTLTNGTGTFSVTLVTAGNQQIVATDTVTSSLTGSANVLVSTIHEYPIPTTSASLMGIAPGSDGNVWFIESAANQIGVITPAGMVNEYALPTAGAGAYAMTLGPDGNLWFTEANANQIGMITPSGSIMEFPIPTANSQPEGIVAGLDGNLWFTEAGANQIGMITTAGVVTEYAIPTANSGPNTIAVDAAGNLWFTEANVDQIGEITTSGMVTEYTVPTTGSGLSGIALGSDGNLWFTEANANQIGQINTSTGMVTEFPLPTAGASPSGIVAGSDGNLWFIEAGAAQIGQINPTTDAITEFAVPTAGSSPLGIASGPDGNLWFTESAVDQIGQFVIGGPIPPPPGANGRDRFAARNLLISALGSSIDDRAASTGIQSPAVALAAAERPAEAPALLAAGACGTNDSPATLGVLGPDQTDQLFSRTEALLASDWDGGLAWALPTDWMDGRRR